MKKVFYEKVGKRYKPIKEYDDTFMSAFPKGTHLVVCRPGITSYSYQIDPAFAPMVTASKYAEDDMARAIVKGLELKPKQTPITLGQQRAWKKLAREFGDELCTLNGASAYDIAQAGLKALEQEADKLMTNASVKAAYDQFLFVCALTKQQRK